MKPYPKIHIFLCWLVVCSLVACRDIIEPSITDRNVIAYTPGDQYQSTSYSTSFWWEEVEDALNYRLQVVSGRFDAPGALVLDTVVKINRFTINVNPGEYQWRVRAQNGSSQTQYSAPKTFNILFSSIKQQKVQLLSPGNGVLTNQAALVFQWGNLYGATKYRVQIDTANFVNESALLYNHSLPSQQLSYNFTKDQAYQWRVRAENDTAQAQWSTVNLIIVDRTPPAKVLLTAPVNNQTVAKPVALQWNASSGANRYKLFVFRADSMTTYNATFPLTQTTANYSFNLGATGDVIYWRVAAIDAAGNEGTASDMRRFVIQ